VAADGAVLFGPYVLLRRIARGGMAEVFLARPRGLTKRVTITAGKTTRLSFALR
jgi:hypothetical protein